MDPNGFGAWSANKIPLQLSMAKGRVRLFVRFLYSFWSFDCLFVRFVCCFLCSGCLFVVCWSCLFWWLFYLFIWSFCSLCLCLFVLLPRYVEKAEENREYEGLIVFPIFFPRSRSITGSRRTKRKAKRKYNKQDDA
ncbi:MAG: hypothetical protein JOS17DRAFT_511706 [Linnemannia elongata]|nr:MAG: hypothetical protein JOS17DRAFT_511706 [Linnemannia elongata]